MKIFILLAALGTSLILAGCGAPVIKTTWKAQHNIQPIYNKILVVAITDEQDVTLRKQLEKTLSDDLMKLGYKVVSALEEYGPKGLAASSEAETYIKLRNTGIDAVITMALIDKDKEVYQKQKKKYRYPSNYYYNRIWNYRQIQPEAIKDEDLVNKEFFWESILFDLKTLEPQSTMQTKPFTPDMTESKGKEYEKKIIHKMVKEKILRKQSGGMKPF